MPPDLCLYQFTAICDDENHVGNGTVSGITSDISLWYLWMMGLPNALLLPASGVGN
jgi:hypothetical protein